MITRSGLLALGRECSEFEADFLELQSAYRRLDRYYIITRYPNGLPGLIPAEYFEEDEAREAVGLVERIVALVRARIEELAARGTE